jgi:hypothetical protein
MASQIVFLWQGAGRLIPDPAAMLSDNRYDAAPTRKNNKLWNKPDRPENGTGQ